MDIAYPYADDIARLRLLYRLPTVPAPQRLLLVAPDDAARQLGQAWPGPVTVVPAALALQQLGRAQARFDTVALPQVLGLRHALACDGPAMAGNQQVLDAAWQWLVPGGAVVGHLPHGWALRRAWRPRGWSELARAGLCQDAITTPAQMLRQLRASGFSAPHCFYVQPSMASPMALVPCQAQAAKAHFLRAIRAARSNHGHLGQGLRLLLAHLGLAGMLQSDLLFWAHKPC